MKIALVGFKGSGKGACTASARKGEKRGGGDGMVPRPPGRQACLKPEHLPRTALAQLILVSHKALSTQQEQLRPPRIAYYKHLSLDFSCAQSGLTLGHNPSIH